MNGYARKKCDVLDCFKSYSVDKMIEVFIHQAQKACLCH